MEKSTPIHALFNLITQSRTFKIQTNKSRSSLMFRYALTKFDHESGSIILFAHKYYNEAVSFGSLTCFATFHGKQLIVITSTRINVKVTKNSFWTRMVCFDDHDPWACICLVVWRIKKYWFYRACLCLSIFWSNNWPVWSLV